MEKLTSGAEIRMTMVSKATLKMMRLPQNNLQDVVRSYM